MGTQVAEFVRRKILKTCPYNANCIEISKNSFFTLGGPVLWQNDGSLVGVSSGTHNARDQGRIQIFTNVPYYYKWIEQVTGLELPKCHGPQANAFA